MWRHTNSVDPSIAIDYGACIRRVPKQAKSLRDVASSGRVSARAGDAPVSVGDWSW